MEIMMTSSYVDKGKPGTLEGFDGLFSGYPGKLHATTGSLSFTSTSTGTGFFRMDNVSIYPVIASPIFFSAESQSSPSETHPGNAGTVTVYPPSSFLFIRTVYRIRVCFKRIPPGTTTDPYPSIIGRNELRCWSFCPVSPPGPA